MLRNLAILAFIVSLAPMGASAQPAPVERRDAAIFKDVVAQVNTYTRFTVFDDIQASISQGVVTLYGRVTMPYKRNDIEKRVKDIAGVRQVIDKIVTLPVSPYDDDLRRQIAHAIYGNPSFWHYASMANPPIHIVVENGHVTLTGVVNNEVERVLARSLATGSSALSVKSELRTDAEARADLERVERGSE